MTPANSSAPASGAAYGDAVQPCPLHQTKSWIAIQLVGEDDKGIPGARYRILLVDGTSQDGTLDGTGSARVDNIDPGTCVITFPDLDQDAWTAI